MGSSVTVTMRCRPQSATLGTEQGTQQRGSDNAVSPTVIGGAAAAAVMLVLGLAFPSGCWINGRIRVRVDPAAAIPVKVRAQQGKQHGDLAGSH